MTDLQYYAETAMGIHKMAYEKWREGDISRFWLDVDGILCVQYESGNWWHYMDLDSKHPIWW